VAAFEEDFVHLLHGCHHARKLLPIYSAASSGDAQQLADHQWLFSGCWHCHHYLICCVSFRVAKAPDPRRNKTHFVNLVPHVKSASAAPVCPLFPSDP
jgi:hypothetical protein